MDLRAEAVAADEICVTIMKICKLGNNFLDVNMALGPPDLHKYVLSASIKLMKLAICIFFLHQRHLSIFHPQTSFVGKFYTFLGPLEFQNTFSILSEFLFNSICETYFFFWKLQNFYFFQKYFHSPIAEMMVIYK